MAVASAVLLAGCSFTSDDVTLQPYAPSDGLQVDLGDVLVRNVLVVSEGAGEPGVLSGTLVNRGDTDVTVVVEVGGTTAEIDVPTSQSVVLSPLGDEDGETVVMDSVEPPSGGVLDVSFSDPEGDSAVLTVPVVLPEGPYAELTPPAGPQPRSS